MLNSAIIQGRAVRDLELKTTQGGIEYVNFTIAWSEKYNEKERTLYMDCKAWRQTAKFLDTYFRAKGSEMIVEGQLETEKWEKDGEKRSKVVLNVNRVHFCGKRQDAQPSGQAAEAPSETPAAAYVPADDEELPF